MVSTCTACRVFSSHWTTLNTLYCYQVAFAEGLIGIRVWEYRVRAVGVQYNLPMKCPVSPSTLSVFPWAPLQAGASPPFTSFKILIISQIQILITVCREQGWQDIRFELLKYFHLSRVDAYMLEAWQTHSLAAQITGSNNHPKAYGLGDRRSDDVIFYTSGRSGFRNQMLPWGWGVIFLALIRIKRIFLWEIPFSKGCLYSRSTVF